jgi:tetratricopeptide (TPR) repeat protein
MRFSCPLLCTLLLCNALEVSAQETKKVSKAEMAYAKELFSEANEAYRLQEWDKALAKFQESYRVSQKTELLFNIAQCYQQKMQYAEAIQSLNAFINDAPKSSYRAEADKLISELTWLQQKQDELKKEEAKTAAAKEAAAEEAKRKKLTYQVLYGVAFSLGATGAVGEVLSVRGVNQLEEDSAGVIDAKLIQDDLRRVQRTAIVSDALVVTAIIAGGTAFIFQHKINKRLSDQGITLSPMLSQKGFVAQVKF